MKTVEFHKEVLKEATLLREHATKDQKDKLVFDQLDGADTCNCIYGQMTGNCYNQEARNLLSKCAKTIVDNLADSEEQEDIVFNSATPVNFKATLEHTSMRNHRSYFSAIEGYITVEGSKNDELISYIKGEIDTFEP